MSDHDHHHGCAAVTPSRRAVLGAAGALFAWSFVPKFAYAAPGARDSRLVVIILRGALDGLSAVPPLADPDYAGLREGIAIQDVLESGQPGPGRTEDGWLNRLLQAMPEGEAISTRGALGVGVVPPLVVRGAAPVLGWAPPVMPRAGDDLAARLADLYGQRDPALARALARGRDVERLLARPLQGQPRPRAAPDNAEGMRQIAEGAAKLLDADDGPRVAALAFEGWDTHADEGGATGRLAGLLRGLDGAVDAMEAGLRRRWADTAVMVITEFGRTARVNGTVGTDHGSGTAAFLFGGAVKGGRVVADWPGLKTEQLHERRDLKPTTDLRAVIKGVAADLFGLSHATLGDKVFPGTLGIPPMKGLIA